MIEQLNQARRHAQDLRALQAYWDEQAEAEELAQREAAVAEAARRIEPLAVRALLAFAAACIALKLVLA